MPFAENAKVTPTYFGSLTGALGGKEHGMTSPTYELTLHKTYYEQGFFNLGVSVDKYVRRQNGGVKLILGARKRVLMGKIDRDANPNGTPRVFGGQELRNWFFKNYKMKDRVIVTILAPDQIQIG